MGEGRVCVECERWSERCERMKVDMRYEENMRCGIWFGGWLG